MRKLKLQLACDMLELDQVIALLEDVSDLIDIIEIGTPFIVKEGMRPVSVIAEKFPHKTVLADVKIMDGGKAEARYAFEAGAGIVTVMAAAELQTIHNVIELAAEYKRQVLVDMLGIEDLPKRAAQIDRLKPDYICVHTAFDVQHLEQSPIADLARIKPVLQHAEAAVAGGLSLATIPDVVPYEPGIVIVGGAIIHAADPQSYTAQIRRILNGGID